MIAVDGIAACADIVIALVVVLLGSLGVSELRAWWKRRNVHCTGIAATWCPIHGDCTCERAQDGRLIIGVISDCPLHGNASVHAGEYA